VFERSEDVKRRLRRQRRDRNSSIRDQEKDLAPPVIRYDQTLGDKMHDVRVGSLRLKMPVAPMRPQLQLQHAAERALQGGMHALLQSPTGTGKTLALLCTALGYQWARKSNGDPLRVVWVARTHQQLQHTVNELRRLPYRPMLAWRPLLLPTAEKHTSDPLRAPRLSRERFCLHPNIRTARNKAEACEVGPVSTTTLPDIGLTLHSFSSRRLLLPAMPALMLTAPGVDARWRRC